MKKLFAQLSHGRLNGASAICIFAFLIAQIPSANALQTKEARVTQVIQDVKLLAANTAPRPAAVNDNVQQGTAVRTGQASRTELTFSDQTLTRLGANSVFSFNIGGRTFDLEHGSILMQVPPNGSSVKVKTAAVTAAITGGTALFGTGPPTKFMVLEGIGTFYPSGHPEEAVTLHGGEMVTLTPDGHIVGPTGFNVKTVLETSELIVDFPDLANLPLILAVIREQEELYTQNPPPPPPKDTTEIVDQESTASGGTPTPTPSASPTPSGTPSKFGPPTTINSANPYVINSGTQIQTDPSITTNSVTDYGTIYRDEAHDGTVPDYLYGSSRPFDAMVFDEGGNEDNDYAVFKFQSLQLAGDPIISTADGGATNLALVSVGPITSAGPGGTLTFAGMQHVFIGTQNGSITLGPEISFAGLPHLGFYARGAGSNLTLGSTISNIGKLELYAEGTIQINGDITVTDQFKSFSGGDFLAGTGTVTATNIDIQSLANINIDASKFPDLSDGGGTITLNAANTLSIINMGGVFDRDTLTAQATTINLEGTDTPTEFDFSASSSVTFTAGTGGINAPTIFFFGHNLTLESGGDIDIYSAQTPSDINENQILDGSIDAAGNIMSVGDINTGVIHAGGSMTVGGHLLAGDISADVNVNGALGIVAVGGSIVAGGDITSTNGTVELQQDENGEFGNITAGGNINANGGIFTPGDPVVVMAGGSITAPGVITGTLHAGTDITIDNTGGSFGFGIVANHIIAGGTLYLINSPTISPNNGGSGNHDGETFDDFTMTVGAISSTGPTYPVLSSNGGNANPDFSDSNPGNGGNITLNITASGLHIGASDLDSIQANGGAYNGSGPFGGGNGGTINITAAGNVIIDTSNSEGPSISATTGQVTNDFTTYAGDGGTVNLTSSGSITVNGTVQVSSDDARYTEVASAGSESASGGTIDLQSNLTTGTGITISSNAALLSFLSGNAPGPAGSITLSTEGADIVVNGTVRADFGTITIDQDDPAGMTPTITLDGCTLQTATFNINGSGDLAIGLTSNTAINIFGGTWNVPGDITLNAANTSFAYSFSLNATAGGSINFVGGNSDAPATLTLPLSGDTTFTASAGSINAQYVDLLYSGGGLNLSAGGDITAHAIKFTDSYARGQVNAGGALSVTTDLFEGIATAGTSVSVGGNTTLSTLTAGTTVSVGGYLQASSVTAGGDISAYVTYVQTITSPTGVFSVADVINPYVFSTDPSFPEQGAKAPHVYTVDSIVSPNGIDFSGNQFGGIDGYSSGGLLTINARTLSFDPSTGIGIVNFNGADAGATDFSDNVFTNVGGDGGKFVVNATGDITVTSDSPISATTGQIDPNLSNVTSSGAGGTVELNSSTGTVSVDSTIQVSSAEPTSTIAPFRSSASGGNIKLTSGKTSGVAINVTSSAQLLSLLNAATVGSGGKVTILASAPNNSGNSSSINIDNSNGLIAADGTGGTVDIEHNGDGGTININNANIRADVVKVGAFGDNGTLNIGGGTINADSMLKLYAPGSNGHLNFIANVTLNSGLSAILAANTISIQPTIVVNITGSGGLATIYTNHPDYNFTPQPGYTGPAGNPANGSFGGNGAHDPQPLPGAPTF